MITDLVNQTTVGAIRAEWELTIILNCNERKSNSLERGSIGN